MNAFLYKEGGELGMRGNQSVDEPAKSLLRGPIREDSSRETAPIATGEPDVSRNPSRPLPQMRRRRR